MANLIQYTWDVKCDTEGALVQKIQKSKPTTCPNNAGHTVDLTNTFFTASEAPNGIYTNPGSVGFYLAQGINFTAAANSTTTYDFSYPFDVRVISARFLCEDTNQGDTLNVHLTPGLTIGALAVSAVIGDTIITLSSTAIDNSVKGMFFVFIGDATNYYIKSVNLNNSTVTLTSALTANFTAGTGVSRTVHLIKDLLLPSKETIAFLGQMDLPKPLIPANFIFRFKYTNASLISSKTVNFIMDVY